MFGIERRKKKTSKLRERFLQEGGLDYFDERDTVGLILEVARCPGDREKMTDILMDEFGSMKAILEAREEQLTRIRGIGKNTAATIRMVVPLLKAWEKASLSDPTRIGNAQEAERYCKSLLAGLRNEQFYVICLNSRCKILGKRRISEGSLSEVNAYPRVVTETALNYNAHSILFCHNHPGGTNYPSPEDISSTIQMQQLLKGLQILVLDHIIVAGNKCYSMVQHGDICYR